MRGTGRKNLAVAALSVTLLGLWAEAASAEPPYIATCGVVRALSAPTGTAAGSVTIGDRTLALRAGDRIPPDATVGRTRCINRTVTTSGPVLQLEPMPSPACGEVIAVLEAVPGQRGELIDIVTTVPGLRIGLDASPALQFTFLNRATQACFEIGIDARGRAVALRVMGAVIVVPTPAPVATLPSTATGSDLSLAAGVALGLASLAALVMSRLRRWSAAGR